MTDEQAATLVAFCNRGKTTNEIVARFDVDPRTVRRWFRELEQRGHRVLVVDKFSHRRTKYQVS